MRNRVLLLLSHIISLVLLVLGLTENMLEIDITKHFIVDFNLFNEKRSVLSTLQSLWESGNHLPFILIFLFGIVVPLAKSVIIFYLLLAKNPANKYLSWIKAINKWAMADVFAISIFVAFLGSNAMSSTKAILESGFYWFTSYVLLSSIISIFVEKLIQKQLTFRR